MKIAIAGFGIEGRSSYQYWLAMGADITIADERRDLDGLPAGVPTILGPEALSNLFGFDMVVRSAGIAPNKIKTDGKVWSSTNEFFAKCPAPIIGVTGSKGKGTTCSLITSILRAAGRTVHLLGNIGRPALDELATIMRDDIVVYELSSFQLWDIERSPHVAVILGVEPDHLDVHTDMAEYLSAKANICAFQGPEDVCFYHPTNDFTRQVLQEADSQSSHILPYNEINRKDDLLWVACQKDNDFYATKAPNIEHQICPIDTLRLPGRHNIENATAAISAAMVYVDDDEAISRGLHDFTGLPHRLKFVRQASGVKYYDDSIATTPGSTIAAIRSFDSPKVIIVGGSDKGADYTDLAGEIVNADIRAVVAIGSNGSRIADILINRGFESVEVVASKNMADIIARASSLAMSGDVVILSPAAASFDMFKNYSDRGDKFIAAVNEL